MIFLMTKYFTFENVYHIDRGSASLGNEDLRNLLARILTRVPKEIVDAVYMVYKNTKITVHMYSVVHPLSI